MWHTYFPCMTNITSKSHFTITYWHLSSKDSQKMNKQMHNVHQKRMWHAYRLKISDRKKAWCASESKHQQNAWLADGKEWQLDVQQKTKTKDMHLIVFKKQSQCMQETTPQETANRFADNQQWIILIFLQLQLFHSFPF